METEASVSAYYTIKIGQHYANGDVHYIMIFGPPTHNVYCNEPKQKVNTVLPALVHEIYFF